MKNIQIVSALLITLSLEVIATSKTNDFKDVPEWTWGIVAKDTKNTYTGSESTIKAGDTCGLKKGGNVEILGKDTEFGILLKYTSPDIDNKGTPCESGTLIWMDGMELASWPLYKSVSKMSVDKENRRNKAVDEILNNN